MKNFFLATALAFIICSCSKDKGCWQAWDIVSFTEVRNGQVCDKTKEQVEQMETGTFVYAPAGEAKYCWTTSNSLNISCVPLTIMKRAFDRFGIIYTKTTCNQTCRHTIKKQENVLLAFISNETILISCNFQ